MKSHYWFKFDAVDWLESMSIDSMTLEQEGAYIRLLAVQWRRGSIPADEEGIRRCLKRCDARTFKRVWPALEPHFPIVTCDRDATDIGSTSDRHRINSRLEQARKQRDHVSDVAADNAAKRLKTHATDAAGAERALSGGNAGAERALSGRIDIKSREENREEQTHAHPAGERVGSTLALVEAKPSSRFDLDALYAAYPRKEGKAKGMARLRAVVRTDADYSRHRQAIANLTSRIARDAIEPQFVPHFSTWVAGKWVDYADGAPAPTAATVQSSRFPEPVRNPATENLLTANATRSRSAT